MNLPLHRKHFAQNDGVKEELLVNSGNNELKITNQDNSECISDTFSLTNIETDVGIHVEDYQNCLLERVSLLLLGVEAICKFPSTTVQKILCGIRDSHNLSSPLIYDSVKQVSDKYNLNTDIAKEIAEWIVTDYPFVKITSPRSSPNSGQLATPYLRKKYIQNSLPFVKYKEIFLGYRIEKRCSFVYIPVLLWGTFVITVVFS